MSQVPQAVDLSMDATTWAALALVLTVLGAVLSWLAWRRRGAAAGLRGLAWTLLPVAAWLTGTLRLVVNVAEDVVSWASRLVFSPVVWMGLAVGGVAVALWFLSGAMLARGIGVRDAQPGARSGVRGGEAKAVPAARRGEPPLAKGGAARGRKAKDPDDLEDLDDIEAILKKHGI